MITMDVVVDGMLRSDGTLKLDVVPRLAPGRVRVTLQSLGSRVGGERLPDGPWLEESISAPFDLPRPGLAERVEARIVTERLPDLPAALREDEPIREQFQPR